MTKHYTSPPCDHVKAFAAARLRELPDGTQKHWAPCKTVRAAYIEWCTANGIAPLNRTQLSRQLSGLRLVRTGSRSGYLNVEVLP